MISAVDTNVVLDILIPNSRCVDRSLACLDRAMEDGRLIVSEIVVAELSSQFLSEDDLKHFFAETTIELRVSDEHVLWEAGRAWKKYIKGRRSDARCPACGERIQSICTNCRQPIQPRQHIISDFLIGAHARLFADRLITRDRGFYRRYFKGLTIVDPMRRMSEQR